MQRKDTNKTTRWPLAIAITTGLGLSCPASGETLFGDQVIPAGSTVVIDQDTNYIDGLTVGAGAQVLLEPGVQLTFSPGATLTIAGTQAAPVSFTPREGSWDGIRLLDDAVADVRYAKFIDFHAVAIDADRADVKLLGCEFFDLPGFTDKVDNTRFAVRGNGRTDLLVDGCRFGPLAGRHGKDGVPIAQPGTGGQPLHVIEVVDAERLVVTNSYFDRVSGGNGGAGGRGAFGAPGADGANAPLGGQPGDGETGGTGGPGGPGGLGGSTSVVRILGADDALVAQNIVDFAVGGGGGQGGLGGAGGAGGSGGMGAQGVIGDGGAGGAGGAGGQGGPGGPGGSAGALLVFDVFGGPSPGTDDRIRLLNNTVFSAIARDGGPAGPAGPGGAGGAGGQGGNPGLFGAPGPDGPGGAHGSPGALGGKGVAGVANGASVNLDFSPDGAFLAVEALNNIFTFGGPGPKRGFRARRGPEIFAPYNLLFGADHLTWDDFGDATIVVQPGLVTAEPTFADAAAGDFTPAAGSAGNDAGRSDDAADLPTDFLGAPRITNDPEAEDVGDAGAFPAVIDMGAIERPVPPCGDVDGDGIVDISDLNAMLVAWQEDVAPGTNGDVTGDGTVDLDDLNVLLANWNLPCN